jgi:hypothetical protein
LLRWDPEYTGSYLWYHIKLLDQAVHVACAAKITQANIAN